MLLPPQRFYLLRTIKIKIFGILEKIPVIGFLQKELYSALASPLRLIMLVLLFLPVVAIFKVAYFDVASYTESNWQHVKTVVLWDYFTTSVQLMALVGLLSLFLGVVAARLTTLYTFPLRKFFNWAMVLPFAVPAYISAYAFTNFLDYSGPVQIWLREVLALQPGQAYYFPEVRSLGGASVALSLSLYPYIYLFAKAAFSNTSSQLSQVGKLYGLTPLQRFFRITFPLARPVVVVGLAIVFMETLNDFVVVEYFSLSTLSLGVYSTWVNLSDVHSAARLALVTLFTVMVVMAMEKKGRSQQKHYVLDSSSAKVRLKPLKPLTTFVAICFLGLPVLIGFVFPLLFVSYYALPRINTINGEVIMQAIGNSLFLATSASFLCVLLALLLVYAARISSKHGLGFLYFALNLGYSLPGTVLAVGILSSFSWMDEALRFVLSIFFRLDAGLIIAGTSFTLLYAYFVHFALIPFSLFLTNTEKISPSLTQAANMFGYSRLQIFFKVYYPLLKRSVFLAFLIVFIDCVKEVPLTLILRPFDFETVSTHLYGFISDEAIERAALPSLLVMVISLLPLFFIARSIWSEDSTVEKEEP